MTIYLLGSLLLIPVLLLAAPPAIFEQKGRRDIAFYYLLAMAAVQLTIVIMYWSKPSIAAFWVQALVGLSLSLSALYLGLAKKLPTWSLTLLILLAFNGGLIYLTLPWLDSVKT